MRVGARKIALTVRALGLVLVACGGGGEDYGPDEEPEPPPPIENDKPLPPSTSLDCPSGTFLNYQNFGDAFLRKYCTVCHSQHVPEAARGGAPLTANFDSAEDVALWRASILNKATGDKATMPPSGHTTSADKAQLLEWLNCGAPRR